MKSLMSSKTSFLFKNFFVIVFIYETSNEEFDELKDIRTATVAEQVLGPFLSHASSLNGWR